MLTDNADDPTMLPYHSNVSSPYGAPMGRRSQPLSGKVYLRQVRLFGDYDAGGAYWGFVARLPLYCAWNDEGEHYVRAANRNDAKLKFPNCTFYR